ncbi:MAG: hypothetical protein AAFX54_03105 [Pseudomonadota bacterium]
MNFSGKHKNRQTLRASFLAGAILFIAAPAHACYTVHVDNQSTKDIHTIWTAEGCAGVDHWTFLACDKARISAGESKSYNYKWGVTKPNIFFYQTLTIDDKPEREVIYGYHHGVFKMNGSGLVHQASPAGCGDSYTITLTENLRTKWLGS